MLDDEFAVDGRIASACPVGVMVIQELLSSPQLNCRPPVTIATPLISRCPGGVLFIDASASRRRCTSRSPITRPGITPLLRMLCFPQPTPISTETCFAVCNLDWPEASHATASTIACTEATWPFIVGQSGYPDHGSAAEVVWGQHDCAGPAV